MLNGQMLTHIFLFISVMQGSSLNSQQQRRTDNEKEEREREKNKYKDTFI